VSDGDTLDICIWASRIRARLCGIDAPERDEATKAFRALVVQGTIRRAPVGQGSVCDGRY
jgi:endonuclease YncB( thermonuclease family)